MNIWKNIEINDSLVKARTAKSVLIAFPRKSQLHGYSFWHPAKLVRTGRIVNTVSIGYSGEFVFRLKKYGNGKYNKREVVSEMEIGTDEFEQAFAGINSNDVEPDDTPEIHIPEPLEPENAVADESLIDYD